MKIICPKCGADYNISDSKIPPDGLQIKCPKCLHSFLAHKDGSTNAVSAAGGGRSMPPPPPGLGDLPPAGDLDLSVDLVDEIEDLDDGDAHTIAQTSAVYVRTADGRVLGPMDAHQINQMMTQGQLGGQEQASRDQLSWFALTEVEGVRPPAPAGDFDFSFGEPTPGSARPDDFDFSFGEAPPPPPSAGGGLVPPPGGGGLNDLFDDLPDDLPAPKHSPFSDLGDLPAPKLDADLPAPVRHQDLPTPAGVGLPTPAGHAGLPTPAGHAGLPGLPNAELPGLRRDGDLPTPKGVVGADPFAAPPPSAFDEGLVAPEEDIPGLPDSDAAHDFASGMELAEEIDALGEAPGETPGDKKKKKKKKEKGPGLPKPVLMGIAAVALIGVAVGGMFMAGIGPFGEEEVKPPPRRPKKPKKKAPIAIKADAGAAVEEGPDEHGILPTGAPSLAERAGYQLAITPLEADETLAGEKAVPLLELYAFGALEHDVSDWAIKGHELINTVGDAAKTPRGALAVAAAELAKGTEGAADKALAATKKAKKSQALQLRSHAFMAKDDAKKALEAIAKAVAADEKNVAAQRIEADLLLATGKVEEARAKLESLYAKVPGAPGVNVALARLETRKGSPEKAGKLLDQALELEPARLGGADKSAALLAKARLEIKSKLEDKAMASLEEAIRAWPENGEALDLLSARHFERKAYDKALTQFENLQAAKVESPHIAIMIARCHEALGRRPRARRVLEKAETTYPKEPTVATALGDLHIKTRAFEDARKAYDRALKIDEGYQPARLRIASLLVKEAKVREAITYLQEALKKNPTGALLHVGLADLSRELYDSSAESRLLDDAAKGYRKALSLDPALLEPRANLARVLQAQGKSAEALAVLEELVDHPNWHKDLSYELGEAKQALDRVDEAIGHYTQALAKNPKDARYLMVAGSAHFQKQNYPKARELELKAIEVDPKLMPARYYLGRVEFAQGNAEAAVARFRQALEYDKLNYTYRYWLGRALEKSGRVQLPVARAEYERVSTAAKKDARLAKTLCDVFYRLGLMKKKRASEWRGAHADFKRASKCAPERGDVLYELAELTEFLGNEMAAYDLYLKAAKKDPKLAKALVKAAEILARKEQRPRQILKLLRDAVKADPKFARPHYMLCAILKDKDRRTATAHCEKYLVLAPKGPDAAAAKDLLRTLKGE